MIQFRPAFWLSIGTLLGVVVLIGLGVWQAQRMGEKQALFDAIAARLDEPALAAEALTDAPALEFRAINAAVATAPTLSVWGAGARSFQLGRLANGRAVMIETGVKGAGLQPGTRVSGILRRLGRDRDLPADEPAKSLFYDADQPLAAALGADGNGVWYVAALRLATPSGQTLANPRADPRQSQPGPERHLGYAATWFGLAIGLVMISAALHVRLGRLTLGRSPGGQS